MTPEARRFQEAKRTYEAEVRAIRQRYIAEMKQKFEEEQAKKRCVGIRQFGRMERQTRWLAC